MARIIGGGDAVRWVFVELMSEGKRSEKEVNAYILSLEDKARKAFDVARKAYYDCDIKCEFHALELQRAAAAYAVFVEAYC